jgi:hypothetical protein
MRPRLNDRQKGLLAAIVEAERSTPSDRRGLATVVIEMAGRSAAPSRGIFPAHVDVWPEDLWKLAGDRLLRVWQESDHTVGYQVLPAAEDEYELIREEQGQPTPELRAIRLREHLDRRYRSFSLRVANVIGVFVFVVLGALATVAVLVNVLAGIPIALVALATIWAVASSGSGKTPRDMALAARARTARPIETIVRRLVEGTGHS